MSCFAAQEKKRPGTFPPCNIGIHNSKNRHDFLWYHPITCDSIKRKRLSGLVLRHNADQNMPSRSKGLAVGMTGGDSASTEFDNAGSSSPQKVKMIGRSILVFVAFLYGTLNVCLRRVYTLDSPPTAPALSATRGILAALCFAHVPFQRQRGRSSGSDKNNRPIKASSVSDVPSKQPTRRLLWETAFDLAIWNFMAQGFINVGLIYCSSARVSFLTQSSVVFTPLLSSLVGHRNPLSVWFGAGAAFLGLCILSSSGARNVAAAASSSVTMVSLTGIITNVWRWLKSVQPGDGLVLAGALSWSVYLLRLSRASSPKNNKHGIDFPTLPLQAIKTFLIAIMYTCWWALSSCTRNAATGTTTAWWTSRAAWFWLLVSAIGPGALADVLQQKGQRSVSAAEANIILSSEPVFTAVCGLLLLGERVTTREMGAGALILLATVFSSF